MIRGDDGVQVPFRMAALRYCFRRGIAWGETWVCY